MLAALPPGQPGKGQLHEAFDIARVPVELDVLIDCDSVSETTSCFEALVVLLGTHGIGTWRYSDDGPPAGVRRCRLSRHQAAGRRACDRIPSSPFDEVNLRARWPQAYV